MYNFVLDDGHCLLIDGYRVCTLAHDFTDNAVISHPYLGTDAVLRDLQNLQEYWRTGLVELVPENFYRNKGSKLISSIVAGRNAWFGSAGVHL